MKWIVYIIACEQAGCFYIGITSQYEHRMGQHKLGQGAAFVKRFGFLWSAILETAPDKSTAMKLESYWVDLLSRSSCTVAGAGKTRSDLARFAA